MILAHPERLELVDASIPDASIRSAGKVTRLEAADLPALQALYEASYPGNWFDPRMLETGCYYGFRSGMEILSVAGIHVYSPSYRVAALGNITTHPAHRGRGLCISVTARLCHVLLQEMDFIGLNVKADNAAAIHCYEKLGFERAGEYEEYLIETC
jgi:RimJ/RimL family protein N-acetyltransferase